MTIQTRTRRKGRYGIDAPYAFGGLAVIAFAYLVIAIFTAIDSGRVWLFLPVLFMLTIVTFVFHTTLRGKFIVWAELLDKVGLRGDERILDLGCGRGAVLLMAAERLSRGRAVGVDLWRGVDQSGNSAGALMRNAVAEGVVDRVELCTGDMMALPFEDNSFDLLVSSLAIHNISGRDGRDRAINEAVRVLRPGGRLMIADIRATGQYRAQLTKIGMNHVARTRLGRNFWWGGPWAATLLVTATKPELRN